jgi:hypothetical protein
MFAERMRAGRIVGERLSEQEGKTTDWEINEQMGG